MATAEANNYLVSPYIRSVTHLNTWGVFGYIVNDIYALILANFVVNYQLKGILVIT